LFKNESSVTDSRSIEIAMPAFTRLSIFLGWSPTKGNPRTGTPASTASYSPDIPPWLMNSFTLGCTATTIMKIVLKRFIICDLGYLSLRDTDIIYFNTYKVYHVGEAIVSSLYFLVCLPFHLRISTTLFAGLVRASLSTIFLCFPVL